MSLNKIAILPSSQNVNISQFLNQLKKSIEKHLPTQIIRNNTNTINDSMSLFICDATLTEWTIECFEQADLILTITAAKNEMDKTTYLETIQNHPTYQKVARKELVILHEKNEKPQNTTELLDAYQPDNHYHVRSNNQKDLDRLGRFLTNNAIGLVLSGGGARGFAHIGVFEALQTSGIEIDAIGGTSIGSIMGAAIASGMEGDVLRDNVFNAFVKDKPLNDYTLPLISFAKGDKLERILQKYFGLVNLEDLWLPFFCVSADITLQEEHIHRRGKLWSALRATVSLPGVLPPVVADNSLLVDGGVMNNLPVDVMKDTRIKKIIAVDLNENKEYQLNYDKMPTWKTILLNVFKSKQKKYRVPRLLTVMSTSTVVASYYQAKKKRQLADICFLPPVGRFSFLNFNNFDALVNVGYDSALAQIHKTQMTLVA